MKGLGSSKTPWARIRTNGLLPKENNTLAIHTYLLMGQGAIPYSAHIRLAQQTSRKM
jgi:hypothetical protein